MFAITVLFFVACNKENNSINFVEEQEKTNFSIDDNYIVFNTIDDYDDMLMKVFTTGKIPTELHNVNMYVNQTPADLDKLLK